MALSWYLPNGGHPFSTQKTNTSQKLTFLTRWYPNVPVQIMEYEMLVFPKILHTCYMIPWFCVNITVLLQVSFIMWETYGSFLQNKKCITTCSLTNDILSFLVVHLKKKHSFKTVFQKAILLQIASSLLKIEHLPIKQCKFCMKNCNIQPTVPDNH